MSKGHTPGPWTWAHDEFNRRYLKTNEEGNFRLDKNLNLMAKPGYSLRDRWVIFLRGPEHSGIGGTQRDEWDYHQVFRLRWSDLREKEFMGGPHPADMALIASAPELLAALHGLLDGVEGAEEEARRVIAQATKEGQS